MAMETVMEDKCNHTLEVDMKCNPILEEKPKVTEVRMKCTLHLLQETFRTAFPLEGDLLSEDTSLIMVSLIAFQCLLHTLQCQA